MQAEQRSVWKFDQSIFWGSIIWITGIIVMAFWQGLRIWNMNRLVNAAQPAPEWLSRLLEETCLLLPVPPPQIFLVRGISTPLVWAWKRPMLLWPEELSEQLSPQAKQGVLLHELAHLKRKDHWVGRLELVAGCLWWPNPLFWYVRHQLRENAELACDAWVVQTLPNGRRDYADALLTVCQNYSHPAVPLPALGMGKSTRRTLERRLTMILRDRVPFRVSWWGMIAVLLLGVLILPSWSQSKEESPRLPEVESIADDAVGEDAPAAIVASGIDEDLLAKPKDRRADDSKLKGKKDNRRFTDIELKGARFGAEPIDVDLDGDLDLVTVQKEATAEKAAPTDRGVSQKDSEGKYELFFKDTPNTARVRDLRLQQIEEKLQSLLGELRELRGKKGVRFTPQLPNVVFIPQPPKVVDGAESVSRIFGISGAAKQRDMAKANRAKAQAALGAALRQKEAEEKQAEVVETKTITLVRTTYRITRVDVETLEKLLKNIVKSDMLQIKITKRPIGPGGQGFIPAVFDQTITVTTTPEHQEYIGRLIALIEKAPRLEAPKQSKRPTTTGKRGKNRQSESRLESLESDSRQRPVRKSVDESIPSDFRRKNKLKLKRAD
jgi:beta-lactamase regulating signal transducer with metallopeptidase domain/ribosomal protein L29